MEHCCNAEDGRGHQRGGKDLPHRDELAVGMKVMVTDNVETDLDITNGACGEIVGIVLHLDEAPIDKYQAIVKIQYLPSYILVKLSRTRATQLEGFEEGIVPIEPISTSYKIKVYVKEGKALQHTIKCLRLPVTAAYAFTDYRSQGQTIQHVIVDIASPPTGTLNLFNLYVALSHSAGRHSIRLLRDFDDRIFKRDVT